MGEGLRIVDRQAFIEVQGTGLFSEDDADRHLRRLATLIGERRARGSVAVLVDMTGSSVQRPELARSLSLRARELYEPRDRVAIVAGSMLQRLQMQRVGSDGGFAYFLDRAEAERHLVTAEEGS